MYFLRLKEDYIILLTPPPSHTSSLRLREPQPIEPQPMGPQPREPQPMGPQSRKLKPYDISLNESLGIVLSQYLLYNNTVEKVYFYTLVVL